MPHLVDFILIVYILYKNTVKCNLQLNLLKLRAVEGQLDGMIFMV